MRWSIIRLIWWRELRDQLRDRRTLFMIAGLPLILYPILGFCVLTFALQFFTKPSRVGIPRSPDGAVFPPRPALAGPATAASVWAHAALGPTLPAAAARGAVSHAFLDYPPLVVGDRWFVSPSAPRPPAALL